MVDLATADTPYGKFSYWPNDGIGHAIAGGAFWDAHFKPVFDLLTPGMRVIDAGANLGWFSIYAAKKGCRVFAFEPCPQVFDLLRINVLQNGLEDSISTFPLALYSRCERLTMIRLNLDDPSNQVLNEGRIDESVCRNSGSSAFRPFSSGVMDGLPSPYGIPLDYFNLTAIKLLKIDTEGCDLEVLKGARKTILMSKPIICYECLSPTGSSREYDELMDSLRYRTEQVHEAMEGTYKDFVARPE